MYYGEVSVVQVELNSFLAVAEELRENMLLTEADIGQSMYKRDTRHRLLNTLATVEEVNTCDVNTPLLGEIILALDPMTAQHTHRILPANVMQLMKVVLMTMVPTM